MGSQHTRPNLRLIVAALVSAVTVATRCLIAETFTEDAEGNQLSAGTLIDDTVPMHYATYAARRSQDNRPGRAFDDGMLFDARTSPSQTRDLDLIQDPSRGNMLIITKNRDPANPDDNGSGGTITGTFAGPVIMRSITFIDVESRATIRFYGPSESEIEEMSIPGGVDGQVRVIPMNVDNVSKFSITITGSGAFDDVKFIRPRTAALRCPEEPPAPSPGPPISCVPTTGPCVASYDALSHAAGLAVADDVIAVCGGTTILTRATIEITQPGVTLCCDAADASNEKCILTSIARQRILKVRGNTFTLSGMVFTNGYTQEPTGGNVEIISGGNHRIADCEFYAGTAQIGGGNLYVATSGDVSIERCIFESGDGGRDGGGVDISTRERVYVTGSQFVDNHASAEGGGLYVNVDLHGSDFIVEDSEFTGNSAEVGGGFIATNIGEMVDLKVLRNTFNENVAEVNGGAFAIHGYAPLDVPLTVADNKGSGNFVKGEEYTSVAPCDDISIYLQEIYPQDRELDVCIAVTGQFP